mgnify:CR=1 FL=1
MLRRLIPLLLCLVAVALWIRFQAPPAAPVDPFKLTLRLDDPSSRLFYEFSERDRGAEFRYELLSDGQTFKGSGPIDPAAAAKFRDELRLHQVWKLRGHSDAKQLGSLSVSEGERSHTVGITIFDSEFVSWMFQKDSLPFQSMKKALD